MEIKSWALPYLPLAAIAFIVSGIVTPGLVLATLRFAYLRALYLISLSTNTVL